ncbi:phosphotransferase enzyme family protein [Paenibacillus sp. S-38]|uniref:phosphotransferase enzyme family protein n=1 Tax=Paenibacillus sp. S-38 TaxID=3416710 RepID=UPI003CEF178A
MSLELEERSAAEIAEALNRQFGWPVSGMLPIDKGWLNVKWKAVTDQGPVFVKCYHPERYRLHTRPERKNAIERTLGLQHELSRAGIACPEVYRCGVGPFLQEAPSGLYYTVQEWTDGYTAEAGELNAAQMDGLGITTGRMHRWLQSVPPLDKPAWRPDKAGYLKEWQGSWEKADQAGDETVLEWLSRSQAVVESLDFGQFDSCRTGWLHWDLWVDNIVLQEQYVAGIVDFDRMTMAYPDLDAARAILSGCLRKGQLQMDTARAFMNGYRTYVEMPEGTLSCAVRMLYLIESLWWLRTEVRLESGLRGLLARFIEEMHWIEDHWESLSDILGSL